MKSGWLPLNISKSELSLQLTLFSGQSFRWKQFNDSFVSVLNKQVVVLKQDDNDIYYQQGDPGVIRDYFQLHINLSNLYQEWQSDQVFKSKSEEFKGVRMLRIDPVENLFSFICSSNNNIARISQMVENMCIEYGEIVGKYEDQHLFAFPAVERLVGSESKLRELGFGYRAKYIDQTASQLLKLAEEHSLTPRDFLLTLRKKSYEETRTILMQFSGVGPKVADCICLMSCDKPMAVPVDTHVRQIAERDYGVRLPYKSMTPAAYKKIQDKFREVFGDYCGWAHSVLFKADL